MLVRKAVLEELLAGEVLEVRIIDPALADGPVRQAVSAAQGITADGRFGASYGLPMLDDVLGLFPAPWSTWATQGGALESKEQEVSKITSWTDKLVTPSVIGTLRLGPCLTMPMAAPLRGMMLR